MSGSGFNVMIEMTRDTEVKEMIRHHEAVYSKRYFGGVVDILISASVVQAFKGSALLLLCVLVSGCGSSLPKGEMKTKSPWNTFEEAKASYENIILNSTTTADLQELGFDPYNTPNVRILSYLDILQRFNPITQ